MKGKPGKPKVPYVFAAFVVFVVFVAFVVFVVFVVVAVVAVFIVSAEIVVVVVIAVIAVIGRLSTILLRILDRSRVSEGPILIVVPKDIVVIAVKIRPNEFLCVCKIDGLRDAVIRRWRGWA